MKVRFPNIIVGMITRESIRGALANGITAQQIVHYLGTHAHPQTRTSSVGAGLVWFGVVWLGWLRSSSLHRALQCR